MFMRDRLLSGSSCLILLLDAGEAMLCHPLVANNNF